MQNGSCFDILIAICLVQDKQIVKIADSSPVFRGIWGVFNIDFVTFVG